MGVLGLNKLLKKSPHTAAAGTLKEHEVQVDVLSTFYGVLQSQSFNVFTKSVRTTSIAEAEEQAAQNDSTSYLQTSEERISTTRGVPYSDSRRAGSYRMDRLP
ncbi:hypothetical protein B0O80DRAFT_524888, partial [Mortierella sp. GBAus27b]